MSGPGEVTTLIQAWDAGDIAARARVVPLLYHELKRVARGQLGRHDAPTLEATVLLHEALLKLLGERPPAHDTQHFLAVGARAMRQVIVDHARRRSAEKRGGGLLLESLDEIDGEALAGELPLLDGVDLIALGQALADLESLDPAAARVVEMRAFLGLTIEETARALDLHPSKVNREWDFGRAWLRDRLGAFDEACGRNGAPAG
jgi:RNA polymerase sigma factor (TIGR02999 family)